EWLARQLDRHDIRYMKLDNAFVRLSDVERSQERADSFERVDWIHVLGRYALRGNPLLRQGEVLDPTAGTQPAKSQVRTSKTETETKTENPPNPPRGGVADYVEFYNRITHRSLSPRAQEKAVRPRLEDGAPLATLKLATIGARLQPFYLGF